MILDRARECSPDSNMGQLHKPQVYQVNVVDVRSAWNPLYRSGKLHTVGAGTLNDALSQSQNHRPLLF